MMFAVNRFFVSFLCAMVVSNLGWAAEQEKIYVAVEGEGAIAVFDAPYHRLLKRIGLADEGSGIGQQVAPHNVQVAPDGSAVWVTANAGHASHGDKVAGEGHEGMEHAPIQAPADEVIVIDPAADVVSRRLALGAGLHLAHVVLTPDGTKALVTAQNTGAIYEIDVKQLRIERIVQAPSGSQPHGLRISPDGKTAYIALLQGRSLGILDIATGQLHTLALDGAPVQTAVTPNGRYALASLYDTRKIAVLDTGTQSLRYIELLGEALGPVQLYPTPDSRYVYVADQGNYFNQPDSQWVYKVDLQQGRTVWSIKAGTAPHGMVISKDARFAYVTNLVSDDVSVIDLQADREVARFTAGHEPNGISLWNSSGGGTP